MIRILCVPFILGAFLLSCGNNTTLTEDNYVKLIDQEHPPILSFSEPTYHFGTVIEGDSVQHKFEFTNTGKGILLISGVEAACGCTVPKSWSREPIAPGEKGTIGVVLDTKGRAGQAKKGITITANTDPRVNQIFLEGTIVGPTTK